jgi:hypothetical protein
MAVYGERKRGVWYEELKHQAFKKKEGKRNEENLKIPIKHAVGGFLMYIGQSAGQRNGGCSNLRLREPAE